MDNEYIKKYCSQCQTGKGHQSSKKNANSNIENGLCKLVVGSDGLPIRCVGDWGLNKINYIERYFYMFATSMNDKNWNDINYIEICSGPGVCVYRNQNNTTFREEDGSALTIVKNKSFNNTRINALFIDKEYEVVKTLESRLKNLNVTDKAKAIVGDYTDKKGLIDIIKNNLKIDGALNMVTIDPTDCSVPFETVEYILTRLNRVDIIINFAFGTDLVRNIAQAVKGEIKTDKYKKFLGYDQFFDREDIKQFANANRHQELISEYYNTYEKKLKELGYIHTYSIQVKNLYCLLFASKNTLGKKFWKESERKDSTGQSSLNF